jgi:hypothetical protein
MRLLNEMFLAFGRVAATTLKGASNAILANLSLIEDDEGEEGSSEEPMYGPVGYYVRPMPPVEADAADGINPEGAAEVVAVRYGDQVIPLTARDLRCNAQVNPSDGSMGIAHYGGGFVELAWNASKNGSVATIYALRKQANGDADKASVITVNSEQADASIILLHESGQSIMLGPDGQILLCNAGGDAYIEVKDSGEVTVNAASVTLVGGTAIGSSADPNIDPTIQDLPKRDELETWIDEMNTWVAEANGLIEAGIPVIGGGGGSAKAALTAPTPTAVPEYTTKLKAV